MNGLTNGNKQLDVAWVNVFQIIQVVVGMNRCIRGGGELTGHSSIFLYKLYKFNIVLFSAHVTTFISNCFILQCPLNESMSY